MVGIIGAMEEEIRELIEDMTELLVMQPVNRKPQKNGTSQL